MAVAQFCMFETDDLDETLVAETRDKAVHCCTQALQLAIKKNVSSLESLWITDESLRTSFETIFCPPLSKPHNENFRKTKS